MRVLVALLGFAALLATGAWTAALPPPAIAEGTLARSTVGGGAYPKDLLDPLGQHVLLRAPPRRIVSVALSGDEILLELVPPERLAGLTYLIDDPTTTPSHALAPASAARVTEENPEALLALQPGPRRQRGLHARRGHRAPRGRGRAGHRYRRAREPRRRSRRGHGAGRGRRGAGAGAGARGVAASPHRVGRVASGTRAPAAHPGLGRRLHVRARHDGGRHRAARRRHRRRLGSRDRRSGGDDRGSRGRSRAGARARSDRGLDAAVARSDRSSAMRRSGAPSTHSAAGRCTAFRARGSEASRTTRSAPSRPWPTILDARRS